MDDIYIEFQYLGARVKSTRLGWEKIITLQNNNIWFSYQLIRPQVERVDVKRELLPDVELEG